MPTFEITADRTRIELDAQRAGRIVFHVRNTSARGLFARSQLSPDEGTPLEWLTLEDEVTRSYSAGGALDVVVSVSAPADAPVGDHGFHLDVVGVDDPDEDLGRGPEVSFSVTRVVVNSGYVPAFVGAVAGGAIGVAVGLLPAVIALLIALAQPAPPTSGGLGEAIGAALGRAIGLLILALVFGFIGVFGGLWAGPVAGAFIGLRLRLCDAPGITAGFMAVIQPVWTVLMIVALVALSNAIPSSGGGVVVVLLALLFAALALAVPPWPARWLTLWLRARSRPA